jgi:hypothetical protein
VATSAANVRVGVTGGVYFAPTATALPTDSDTALDAAYLDVGYISDDGVTQTIGVDTTDIVAWQNSDVVRKVQTSHDVTFQFTMIETNENSMEAFYGNYSTGTIEITGDQLPRQRMVLEVIDGDDHIRVVIPDAQVIERGDVVYQNGEPLGYPVTVTAYPDDTGVKAYKYINVDATP